MPPHKLCLKQHAIVICIRILNVQHGICNCTIQIVHNFSKHVVEPIFIPRITLIPNEQEEHLSLNVDSFELDLLLH